GTGLRLRTPTSEDYDDIKSFYDGLSKDSVYSRFNGFVRTEFPARMDADADGDRRLVLTAWRADRVGALGSYDRLGEAEGAELAFTVADDFQGRGVATLILNQLRAIAAERGIERFDAEVASSNTAMRRVFERAGFVVRRTGSAADLLVSLQMEP